MGPPDARVRGRAVTIRDAATVILVRGGTHILMGQRGATAAFMPSKFVFPGGAVDRSDPEIPLAAPVPSPCADRLRAESADGLDHALAVAAIRELWEETGLKLGQSRPWEGEIPEGWRAFAEGGIAPDASALRFVFRAVTPPGRTRRFDARFFLADADHILGDPDDFSAAEDELSHLGWVEFDAIRDLDLPFITEVVLAEIAPLLQRPEPPGSVPFFRNDDERHLVSRLHGRSPLEVTPTR
ncbi:NUDIX hydrolase [Aestuariibius insulae]|uniref:NUDIX hydrolase n=1 Tax=Aestuariibius insulae TaxID=2058287 RepID=UPI00345E1F55